MTSTRNKIRFQAVIAQLIDYIDQNELPPGSRLPSERTFEQLWHVSRPTVNKAIACLVAQGRLVREGYRLSVASPIAARVSAPPIHVLCPHAEYQRTTLVRHDLVESAYDGAAFLNTHVIPLLARTGDEQREQLIQLLAAGNCHGFVIWPVSHAPLQDVLEQFTDRGIPFVLCDLDLGDFNFVGTDNEEGAAMAVRHLVELGHRELAYVTDSLSNLPLSRRKDGYGQTCYVNHLLPSIARVIEISSINPETVRDAWNRLRSDYPEVTGVFCSNDLLALHLMRLAQKDGVEIPRQLSVVGFDDIDASALSAPALTTIAQDFYQLGVMATDMLFRQLVRPGGKPNAPCRLRLHPQFVLRASTAAPRTPQA